MPTLLKTALLGHSPNCCSLSPPPEPYSYTSHGLKITFYNYGASINRPRALSCIYYAISDAGEIHLADWLNPIDEEDLRYTYLRVQLSLFPIAEMSWSMWFWAAVAIGIFVEQYDCVAFEYEVELLSTHGIVGSGSLDE